MRNLEIIQRFYREIWNEGHKEVAWEILAEDLVFRGSTGPAKKGISEFLVYVDLIRGALSNYQCVIEHHVTEGIHTVTRMKFSGQHTSVFFGVPPTGKEVSWNGAAFFRIEEGKIKELWVLGDVDSLKQQLGLARLIAP